jgi:hypothetical protein
LALAVVGTGLLAGALPAQAVQDPNPQVILPHLKPFGQTYGEWGRQWWEWAGSFPAACNPILDDGRVTCGDADDQPDGPVWFLAGTFGGSANRRLTVPADKALYFPIFNWMPWSPEDCQYLGLDTPCEADDMFSALDAVMEGIVDAHVMSASLDGVELVDLHRYRALLDEPFTYVVKEGELAADFGYALGPRYPTVSDGFYLMLKPLAKGRHTLNFAVEGFLDVTYDLRVK